MLALNKSISKSTAASNMELFILNLILAGEKKQSYSLHNFNLTELLTLFIFLVCKQTKEIRITVHWFSKLVKVQKIFIIFVFLFKNMLMSLLTSSPTA